MRLAHSGFAVLAGELADQIRFAVPPPDPAADVSDVVVWEPDAAERLVPGALVIGINLGGGGETIEALAWAARARCAAVLLRDPGERTADIAAAASASGVGLLLLGPDVPWSQVLRLADDLVQRREAEGPNGADVPLGDLFALSDAIANMVGGPATLEDDDFRVLAYSRFVGQMDPGRATAILDRRMPEEWAEHLERTGALERLHATGDVVDVADGPQNANRRLIVSVREGGELLGIIWIAEVDRPLPEGAAAALAQAAELAVPHYRRHLALASARRERHQELVRAILEGQGPVQRYADELELPRGGSVSVLAFTIETADDLPARSWERILNHVALTCEAWRWNAVVTRIGRTVLAVAHLSGSSAAEAVTRLGRDIVEHAPATTGQRLHGAASTGIGVRGIPARRSEAELALAAYNGRDGFVHFDSVRARVIVNEVTSLLRERVELRLPGLDRLRASDTPKKRLVPTLRAFLDSGGVVSAAAAELGIHPTTVRYRLDRIGELTGLDLDDPDARLAAALLLRSGGDP